MLDIKYIKENKNYVKEVCKKREMEADIDLLLNLYEEMNQTKILVDKLRNEKNIVTDEINLLKKEGKVIKDKVEDMKNLVKELKVHENKLDGIEQDYNKILLMVPNILHEDVHDNENKVIKTKNEPPTYDFTPKPHWEICEKLKLADFKNGIKLAGERGFFLTGKGARIIRGIKNFILDLHKEYEEMYVPLFVNHDILEKTGFFPGGEKEVYETDDGKVFVGTGEIPLIGRFAGQIIEPTIKMKAQTPCFRREAGKHGLETRGIFRTHQFEKIELVTITNPENAEKEFQNKIDNIERVYKLLKLPYRIVNLAANDCAKKEFFAKDIEVWFEAEKKWAELATIANCDTYAAKRAGIKFLENGERKDCVTIYGTGGVPIRLLIAIINNYQNKDGTINLPPVLWNYCGTKKIE